MRYFSGHSCYRCVGKAQRWEGRVGLMAQPGSYGPPTIAQWLIWAADNGGFGDKFSEPVWLRWLDRVAPFGGTCAFAVVPDRFDPADLAGNFAATMERWYRYKHEVIDRGLTAAWVAQNGATPDDIPPDAGAVFIGGDTEWKYSARASAICAAGKARSRWVHIGRINGAAKFESGALMLADSADGNVLSGGCIINWPRMEEFLIRTDLERPQLRLPIFG